MSAPAGSSTTPGAAAFTGLSAFPLTPLRDDVLDEAAFTGLVRRLAVHPLDSITVLGSTGSYAYLTAAERTRAAHLAVEAAGEVPVIVGVGALRTRQVLAHVTEAEAAGACGVLLAPMTYQPLGEDEILDLFRAAVESTPLPVIVYDNPRTTHVTFTRELYARIAELPGIVSIKIPGVPAGPAAAAAHVAEIRAILPEHVGIGVSGDASGAAGLNAGCDAWYSVIAGTLPQPALAITRAAQQGRAAEAAELSARLEPLWQLFAQLGGSLRAVAAIAEQIGLVGPDCLPLPVQGLSAPDRARVAEIIARLGLDR